MICHVLLSLHFSPSLPVSPSLSVCLSLWWSQGVCTEAGMYALRERRVHVTQEDFEMAVAKVTNHAHDHFFDLVCNSERKCMFPWVLVCEKE